MPKEVELELRVDQAVLEGGIRDRRSSSMYRGEVLSQEAAGEVPCWGRFSARATSRKV